MEQLELSFCVQVKAKGPKEEQVNAITGFSSQIMSEYYKYNYYFTQVQVHKYYFIPEIRNT